MTFEMLDELAHQIGDNQAADQLQKIRQTPFKNRLWKKRLKTG